MDNNFNEENNIYDINKTDTVSEKNKSEYQSVMTNAAVKKDEYFDINNKFVKITLLVLGIIIVVGVAYYLMLWFTNK